MDEDKIRSKIGQIENYISDLKEILPQSFDEYAKSKITKYAIERLFQVIIEAIIDVCAILVNDLKLGPPRDEDSLLDSLKSKLSSVGKIKSMKGFRNVLVHKYSEINDELVFHIASEQLNDLIAVIEEIKHLLLAQRKKSISR
jgi:uncharacterized protein YutE (UPF0331/DUF86 family)